MAVGQVRFSGDGVAGASAVIRLAAKRGNTAKCRVLSVSWWVLEAQQRVVWRFLGPGLSGFNDRR